MQEAGLSVFEMRPSFVPSTLCAFLLLTGCAASATEPGEWEDDGAAGQRATADVDAGRDGGAPATAADARAPVAADGAAPVDAATTHAGCAAGAFCADFEDQRAEALAAPFQVVAPNCSGDGKVAVDAQLARSGRRSLRISSSGGYCNHVFAQPALPPGLLGGAAWVRFYVRFDDVLSDAHVTFLTMRDRKTGKDLRMGGQSRILMWNRESDDATLPELSPSGIALSRAPVARRWTCIEARIDGAAGSLETYVDGVVIPGLVIDQTPTPEIDRQWLRPGKWTAELENLRLGWESYGSQRMTLWIDDLVVSSARPGC